MKDNERNLCHDLLTIENSDSDLKVRALRHANELLVCVRLSFRKLLRQTRSTCRNVVEKSTDHDKPHFNLFFTIVSTSKKIYIFFQSASCKRHCATHWRKQRGTGSYRQRPSSFWLVRSEHAHASYLGLSFRPPGFSPYMGREERRVQGLD